jgi:hypothetical protein
MNNWCICWFSRIFLLRILIFKGLTMQRLYKSFGVKGLKLFIIIIAPHTHTHTHKYVGLVGNAELTDVTTGYCRALYG